MCCLYFKVKIELCLNMGNNHVVQATVCLFFSLGFVPDEKKKQAWFELCQVQAQARMQLKLAQ